MHSVARAPKLKFSQGNPQTAPTEGGKINPFQLTSTHDWAVWKALYPFPSNKIPLHNFFGFSSILSYLENLDKTRALKKFQSESKAHCL